MARQFFCIECGGPWSGIGRTCDRCTAVLTRRAAEAPALAAGVDVARLRATMTALGLDAAELDAALIDASKARVESAASHAARVARISRQARREAALTRVADVAMAAAREAFQREHAADPDLWASEWGPAQDAVQIGAVNVTDAVRDPACNVGVFRLTAERTRR